MSASMLTFLLVCWITMAHSKQIIGAKDPHLSPFNPIGRSSIEDKLRPLMANVHDSGTEPLGAVDASEQPQVSANVNNC